jgi:hypothetical protein
MTRAARVRQRKQAAARQHKREVADSATLARRRRLGAARQRRHAERQRDCELVVPARLSVDDVEDMIARGILPAGDELDRAKIGEVVTRIVRQFLAADASVPGDSESATLRAAKLIKPARFLLFPSVGK